MSVKIFPKYKSLKHWVKIDDKNLPGSHKPQKWIKVLIDIFDDDIFSSKVSYIGNLLLILMILLSTIEIVLNSDLKWVEFSHLFNVIDTVTTCIFSVEIVFRVALAGYIHKKYKGFWGKIRYLTSFYGIVDLLSILPFYVGLVGPDSYHWLKILRLFRIWRIVRYVPHFQTLPELFIEKVMRF